MGQDVSTGDFNGDGFDDLLATASAESLGGALDLGIVHTIYGSPIGLTAAGDQIWHQNKAGVPGVNAMLDQIGVLGR
ncbi:MAG: FG-GAP repeat protein [Phycisphaerales bacterium]